MVQQALAPQPEEQPAMPTPVEAVASPRPASSEVNMWFDVLPGEFKIGNGPDQQKLDDLAVDVWQCVKGAITAKDLILNRIEVNERFYFNRPAVAVALEPYPGAPNYHIPLVGPRLQQRKASWVDTTTSPDKYFFLTYDGMDETGPDGQVIKSQDIEDAVESDLDFLLRAANFEMAVGEIGETMYSTGIAILWTTFYEHQRGAEWSAMMGPYAGFKFEVIHPNFFLAFKANYPSILRQRLAGHQFELRVADVEQKMRLGTWIEQPVVSNIQQSMRTSVRDQGLQQDGESAKMEDQNVQLGDFLMRYEAEEGEGEKFYRVIADTRNQAVYRVEPYDEDFPWYTPFRIYKPLNAFWPEDSPANDGQSANMMMNALVNNALWGIQYASRQSVLGKGLPGQDSVQNLPPGALIPVNALAETQTISSNFSLSGVDFLVEFVMRLADIAMKVPDTISGGSAKDETATAQQIKYQGFQLMGGADIKATNPSFVNMAQICLNLMYDNWASIWETYGKLGVLKIKDREWLKKPMYISVAGQKPKAAPQIQQAELTAVLRLIQGNPALAQNMELMLELTEKFVYQTSIEGKEDIVKAIGQTTADLGQWMQIIGELKQMGVTPEMAVKMVQGLVQQGTQPQIGQQSNGPKEIINYKDTTGDVRHQMEVQAGLAQGSQPGAPGTGLPGGVQ